MFNAKTLRFGNFKHKVLVTLLHSVTKYVKHKWFIISIHDVTSLPDMTSYDKYSASVLVPYSIKDALGTLEDCFSYLCKIFFQNKISSLAFLHFCCTIETIPKLAPCPRQCSHRNSKTHSIIFSMIFHYQQCKFHDYLMHGTFTTLTINAECSNNYVFT